MKIIRRYIEPGVQWRDYIADPVRLFVIIGGVIVLGYGTRKGINSPFEIAGLDHLIGDGFTIVDVVLITITLVEIIRRLVINDFEIERSRFTRPMLAVLLVVGFIPLLRMFVVEQGIRPPLELMNLPTAIGSFFMWRVIMRREELPVMVWMVIFAGLFKALEGVSVYLTNATIVWGLLTGWRDAMLTTLMLLGGFFAYIIKPENDGIYRKMRNVLLFQLPVTTWIVMSSMRRSYMVAALLSLPILFVAFDRKERRAAVLIFFFVAGLATVSVLVADPAAFSDRFAGIVEPSSEGSSAYRVIENYNVSLMVLEKPIFGWPMATFSQNRTLIDVENISFLMPHNIYLYVMFRAGIFGLIVYLWLMGAMIAACYRSIRAATRPLERFLSFWMTAATVLAILTGFTTPVYSDRLQYFLPFLILMMSYQTGSWPRKAQPQNLTANSLDFPAVTQST